MRLIPTLLLALLGFALAAKQPNILWILADDLDNDYKQDRLAIMPNLKRLREAGVHFLNHVAAQPVCGPSRSSLLQGRFPHNVRYWANDDPPSIANYLAVANNSVGTWLTGAGYHTAFIGKYVNGAEKQVPSGWNFWGAFSSSKGTYNYFNSTPYNITFDREGKFPITPVVDVPMTGIHQADFVGAWGVDQMKIAAAAGLPFFVHTTATMVHEGTCYGPYKDTSMYANDDPFWEADLTNFGCQAGVNAESCSITISACPSDKHKHDFDDLPVPHVPSWNVSASGPLPKPMQPHKSPPLTAYQSSRQDKGYRNRSASAVDLDDMIGVLLKGIEDLGVADNTYVIFTSDNVRASTHLVLICALSLFFSPSLCLTQPLQPLTPPGLPPGRAPSLIWQRASVPDGRKPPPLHSWPCHPPQLHTPPPHQPLGHHCHGGGAGGGHPKGTPPGWQIICGCSGTQPHCPSRLA